MQIPPHLEAQLEEAARAREKSAAELMEEILREWLERHPGSQEADEVLQERWRAAALKCAGMIDRDDLSAENASAEVRARLMRRHAG